MSRKIPGAKIYYATTKALKTYTDVQYEDDCYIMFGKESAGIPEEILMEHKEQCVRIPMHRDDIRSLNLSNSVAIVLYEALRQDQFQPHAAVRDNFINHHMGIKAYIRKKKAKRRKLMALL